MVRPLGPPFPGLWAAHTSAAGRGLRARPGTAPPRMFVSGSAPSGGGRGPWRRLSQDTAYHSLPVRTPRCVLAPLPQPLVVIR